MSTLNSCPSLCFFGNVGRPNKRNIILISYLLLIRSYLVLKTHSRLKICFNKQVRQSLFDHYYSLDILYMLKYGSGLIDKLYVIVYFDTFFTWTVHFHTNDRPLRPKTVQFSSKDHPFSFMTVHYGSNDRLLQLKTVHF